MAEQRFGAAVGVYVLWLSIFGSLALAMAWKAVFHNATFWQPAALCGALLVFMIIWLRAFQIRITDDALEFRSLFRGARRVNHSDIRAVTLGFDISRTGGPLQLQVTQRGVAAEPMSINAKVFSAAAIRTVLDLGKRVARADSGGLEDGVALKAVRKARSRTGGRYS